MQSQGSRTPSSLSGSDRLPFRKRGRDRISSGALSDCGEPAAYAQAPHMLVGGAPASDSPYRFQCLLLVGPLGARESHDRQRAVCGRDKRCRAQGIFEGGTSSETGRRSLYLSAIARRASVQASMWRRFTRRVATCRPSMRISGESIRSRGHDRRGSVPRLRCCAIGKSPVVPATEKPLSP